MALYLSDSDDEMVQEARCYYHDQSPYYCGHTTKEENIRKARAYCNACEKKVETEERKRANAIKKRVLADEKKRIADEEQKIINALEMANAAARIEKLKHKLNMYVLLPFFLSLAKVLILTQEARQVQQEATIDATSTAASIQVTSQS